MIKYKFKCNKFAIYNNVNMFCLRHISCYLHDLCAFERTYRKELKYENMLIAIERSDDMKEFKVNKILGKLRELGYTQEDLANYLNISRTALSRKLLKTKKFNSDEIIKICEFLKVEPNYFFE